MMLGWTGSQLTVVIDPGGGSSPQLMFEGEQALRAAFRRQFFSYEAYAPWIIDQHSSIPHRSLRPSSATLRPATGSPPEYSVNRVEHGSFVVEMGERGPARIINDDHMPVAESFDRMAHACGNNCKGPGSSDLDHIVDRHLKRYSEMIVAGLTGNWLLACTDPGFSAHGAEKKSLLFAHGRDRSSELY
jgi:hypothetical protein